MGIFYDGKPVYVIDTNVLVDYPDIIPSTEETAILEEPLVDLSNAHIVIPTAVIRELSSFKKEASERGKAARTVLRRLRPIFEQTSFSMSGSYGMETWIRKGEQYFSILPLHKDFKKSLPFSPSSEDMDGQIILATIAVEFIFLGIPADGTAQSTDIENWIPTGRVKLLTNDNGLAIRAGQHGVITARYGHKLPAPYTGRRDVIVDEEFLKYFQTEQNIERELWEMYTDEKWDFVANEFIVLRSSYNSDCGMEFEVDGDPYFRYVGRYDKKLDQIVGLRYIHDFPLRIANVGQAIYAEALMNPEFAAVICTGPAGSGKTYMATVYGYYACKQGDYIGVTVVPCASQSRIGALPGDLNDKMDPDVQPFKNALRNFLLKTDKVLKMELKGLKATGAGIPKPRTPGAGGADSSNEDDCRSIRQKLSNRVNAIWDGWFTNLPIETARGRDFSYELALYDEFQDQNITQADTLIKRLGMEGKIVITGDIYQVHAPYLDTNTNGIVYATQLLYDNPMVAKVQFNECEVVRHPLVKMVAEKQRAKKEGVKNIH